MLKNPKFQFSIGVVISVLALAWTLRPVRLSELWAAIVSFKWGWSIPFLVLTFLSMWFRALRWHYLMLPTRNLTATRLFSPMMAGFAINSLFPARAGEFLRASVLSIREHLPFSAVFGTIVLERVFDSITLLLLAAGTSSLLHIDPAMEVRYGDLPPLTGEKLQAASLQFSYFCAVMLVLCIGLLWPPLRRAAQAIIRGTPFAPYRLREKVCEMIDSFAAGMESLKSPRSLFFLFLYSVAVWVVVGASMVVLAWGFPGMKMSLLEGVAITVITCIAILIPAAPGYWGLMEIGIVFGMLVLNVEKEYGRALAYAFVCHSLQIFPIIAVGLGCLWSEGFSLHEVWDRLRASLGEEKNEQKSH
ncbi:MAG: flippase-like domain-containing protein [Candidatus Sumerlaeaceae bacterium]|nr:flippase-like domain-containing protein [Candidatus Sumerlaeaceae bacterium]